MLSGCGNNAPAFSQAAETIRNLVLGVPETPIPRATVAKLPYASITAKLGDLPRGLMVLGKKDGDQQLWVSSNRVALVLRRGRVVRSIGFPQDLRNSRLLTGDPLANAPQRLERQVNYVRELDLANPDYYELLVDASLEPIKAEKITILEIEFDTILLRERNRARTLSWQFENRYWVDPGDGFVWKSVQHIGRDLPPLQIEVAKPAA